ncbi:MAG: hypothetical protein WA718_06360 [Terriglobales bacterium]
MPLETTTVLGCIRRSTQNYEVVDRHGSVYVLEGVGDQLSGEVGHTLEVTGKVIQNSHPRHSARSERPGLPTLRVANVISDVYRVGDHCAAR